MNIQISSILIIIAHSTGFGNSFFKKVVTKYIYCHFAQYHTAKKQRYPVIILSPEE